MKNFIKKFSLLFAVFITGGAVLVIEVTAIRILSPFFGNTIYTVSSVLGVILAALSLGYYLGGKLADKKPSEFWFYSLICLGGFSILILEFIHIFFLPLFAYRLSFVTGPLIVSLFLFFLPSILLGMLSPYAICLEKIRNPAEGTGNASGKVFFWSTLGSIAGSLLSGFFLIPRFGISEIISGTAVVLIALSFPSLIKNIAKKKFFVLFFFLFSLLVSTLSAKEKFISADTIYSKEGVYEKITIYDAVFDGKPARFLTQDRSSSGATFLESDELVYDYTKYFILYKLFKPNIENALAIGGGAYSIPKAYLAENNTVHVDVSEIEPGLFALAKKYFRVSENPRLINFTQDGRRFLFDAKKQYDAIFSDVYFSIYSIPMHFTTREFFELAKSKLTENGVFIANIIGSLSREEPSFFLSELKTFQGVFPNSYVFAVDSPEKNSAQNIIFAGINGNAKIDWENTEKSNNMILKNLSKHAVDMKKYELSSVTILTDNYAPVEFLASQILKNSDKNL